MAMRDDVLELTLQFETPVTKEDLEAEFSRLAHVVRTPCTDGGRSADDPDRDGREATGRDDLDVGVRDPYRLGDLQDDSDRISHSDLVAHARALHDDASLLETASEKIESGEWTPAEAALYVGEHANFGDYETCSDLSDLPTSGGEEDR